MKTMDLRRKMKKMSLKDFSKTALPPTFSYDNGILGQFFYKNFL